MKIADYTYLIFKANRLSTLLSNNQINKKKQNLYTGLYLFSYIALI
jgi:hypothetical protein